MAKLTLHEVGNQLTGLHTEGGWCTYGVADNGQRALVAFREEEVIAAIQFGRRLKSRSGLSQPMLNAMDTLQPVVAIFKGHSVPYQIIQP